MLHNDSPIRLRVQEAMKEENIARGGLSRAQKVKALMTKTLDQWGALSTPRSVSGLGLESFETVVKRTEGFNAAEADARGLVRGLAEMKMPARHIEQVAADCINIFDGFGTTSQVLQGNGEVGTIALSQAIGRSAAAQLTRFDNEGPGLEAFGTDINNLNTDDRLTMSLTIMRPYENIMDKALARVSQASPTVTIRIPSPEAYDWAKTQDANSTVQSRFGSGNTYKLRDLYRNPSPVNSAPKPVVALTANDSTGVLWNSTTAYYKTGKTVSLLDLSRNAAAFTYAKVDRTDLLSDGARVTGIIVAVTNPNGGSPVTENFLVPTRSFDLSMFVKPASSKNSGLRSLSMNVTLPISSTTTQWDGTASTIAAHFTDATVKLNVIVNANLNIQDGITTASGAVEPTLVQLADGTAISGSTTTFFNALTASFVAYSTDAAFDEENQRKANLAIWVQYYEEQFVVPRSRIYFTEYALNQDADATAVETTSSIVALGNGRRGLDVIVNALSDVAAGAAFASLHPEISAANTVEEQSFAASLVKPTVVTTTIDFSTEELNVMNESTRLTEIHGRFRARFLAAITMLFAKSLMLNQYKGGETPVIKAWVHSTIADTVIGILDYHPVLNDEATTATGADYTMKLPNGYRLDIIKSNMDCLQQRIYAVPVIESDMASIISAASIRDCGTVTTNYVPTYDASVVRRVATSTREIVMMSNRVGVCMIVSGLQAQLGTIGSSPIQLNADSSGSLAY